MLQRCPNTQFANPLAAFYCDAPSRSLLEQSGHYPSITQMERPRPAVMHSARALPQQDTAVVAFSFNSNSLKLWRILAPFLVFVFHRYDESCTLLEAAPRREVPNFRSGDNGQQGCCRRALHRKKSPPFVRTPSLSQMTPRRRERARPLTPTAL